MAKKENKRLLSILLVLIMIVQVFPVPVSADSGINWNVPEGNAITGEIYDLLADVTATAEDGSKLSVEISAVAFKDGGFAWNGTDTTITPEAAGAYEVTYSAVDGNGAEADTYSRTVTVDAADEPAVTGSEDAADESAVTGSEDAATTTNPTSIGIQPRTAGKGPEDITEYINFSDFKFYAGTTVVDPATFVPTYNTNYKFEVKWAVDSALDKKVVAGDYFTFVIPKEFGTQNFDLKGEDGNVWAKAFIDATTTTVEENGGALVKVTFTDTVVNKENVHGEIYASFYYYQVTEGKVEKWQFVFEDNFTYTYEGANPGYILGNPIKTGEPILKGPPAFFLTVTPGTLTSIEGLLNGVAILPSRIRWTETLIWRR